MERWSWTDTYDNAHLGLADWLHIKSPRDAPTNSIRDLSEQPYICHNDDIYLSIDVERDCRSGPEGTAKLSEVGISTLDTVDIQYIAPGDRCQNCKHIRLLDNLHPPGPDHNWYCKSKSAHQFAFGPTSYKKRYGDNDVQLSRFLHELFQNMLYNKSLNNAVQRKIILITCAKHLEEVTLQELSLHWLEECYQLYDFQNFHAARACSPNKNEKIGLGKFAAALGIPTHIDHISFAHNGGNDSGIEVQCFLAGSALTQARLDVLRRGHQLEPTMGSSFCSRSIKNNTAYSSDMTQQYLIENGEEFKYRSWEPPRRARSA